MIVTLTPVEAFTAALIGVMRHVQDIRDARKADIYGMPNGNPWVFDIEGALGEQVISKLFKLRWDGSVGNLYAKDVGKLQVRATSRQEGRLILHHRDNDNDIFFLVICPLGNSLDFNVVGWCYAKDGKQPEYVSDPVGGRKAFFVERDALRDVEELLHVDHSAD